MKRDKELAGSWGPLYISKHTSQETIARIFKTGEIGLYSSVRYLPPDHLLKYKCTLCGHEWDSIWSEHGLPKETQKCLKGCSAGHNPPSLLGFYKIVKGLILKKEPFGYGTLIKSKEL